MEKIKIGKTVYDSHYGIFTIGNELHFSIDITDESEVLNIVSNLKSVSLVDDNNKVIEKYDEYKNFISIEANEYGYWVIFHNDEQEVIEVPSANMDILESIETQITDIQLAIAELYEMIGG